MTALFAVGALLTPAAQANPAQFQPTSPPQKNPPLVFEDADHVQHALSDYRGRYVLLNIWATWCGPCVAEMPSLNALQKKLDPRKLAIIALSEDRGDSIVTGFYQQHAIKNLPVAIDKGGIAPSSLHLRGLPTTLLIDPRGYEIARIESDQDWMSTEVAEFLKENLR